jgi:hypothetical protein
MPKLVVRGGSDTIQDERLRREGAISFQLVLRGASQSSAVSHGFPSVSAVAES